MPPLVGVAVNVTLVPSVMLPLGLAAIDTEGVTGAPPQVVVIVMGLLVAVGVETHTYALGVITQVTTSAFAKVVLV